MDYSVLTKILLCVILNLSLTCVCQTLETSTDNSSTSALTSLLDSKISTTIASEASVLPSSTQNLNLDLAYSTMSPSSTFEGISTAIHSQNAANEELYTDTTTNGISETLSDLVGISPSFLLDTSPETTETVIGETVTHSPLDGESSTLTIDISAGETQSSVPQVSSSPVADKMESTALSETVKPSFTTSIISSQPLPTSGDIIETTASVTDFSSSDIYSESITETDQMSSSSIFESTSEITGIVEPNETDALTDMSMDSMIQTTFLASPELDSEGTSEIPTSTEISDFTPEFTPDLPMTASESPMISDSSPSITDFPEPSSTTGFSQSSMTIEPSTESTYLSELSTITTFPMAESSMTILSVPESFSSNDFSEFSGNIESSEISTNDVSSDVSSSAEQFSSFTTIPDVSSLSDVLSESPAMSIEFVDSVTSAEFQSLITLSESSVSEISEIIDTVTNSIEATESMTVSDSVMSSVIHDLSVSLQSSMSSSDVIFPTTVVAMTATTALSTDTSVMATETHSVVTTRDSSQSVVSSTSTLVVPVASIIAPTMTTSVTLPSTPIPSNTTASTGTASPSTGGLSTGGKVAIGILVPLGIIGLVVGGVILYKRYNMTHRSLKAYFNSSIRYRTYTNASFKDDEVALEGTWRSLSNP